MMEEIRKYHVEVECSISSGSKKKAAVRSSTTQRAPSQFFVFKLWPSMLKPDENSCSKARKSTCLTFALSNKACGLALWPLDLERSSGGLQTIGGSCSGGIVTLIDGCR